MWIETCVYLNLILLSWKSSGCWLSEQFLSEYKGTIKCLELQKKKKKTRLGVVMHTISANKKAREDDANHRAAWATWWAQGPFGYRARFWLRQLQDETNMKAICGSSTFVCVVQLVSFFFFFPKETLLLECKTLKTFSFLEIQAPFVQSAVWVSSSGCNRRECWVGGREITTLLLVEHP